MPVVKPSAWSSRMAPRSSSSSRVMMLTDCGVSRSDNSMRVALRAAPLVYDCVPSVACAAWPVMVMAGKVGSASSVASASAACSGRQAPAARLKRVRRSSRGRGRKAGRVVRACGDMIILNVVMVAVVSLLARGTVAGGGVLLARSGLEYFY